MAAEKNMPEVATAAGPASEVERIRDIIFGAQMREYERRFKELERRLELLERQGGQLSDRLDQLHQGQIEADQKLRRELRSAVEEWQAQLRAAVNDLEEDKVGRQDLGDLLVELGTRLKSRESLTDLLAALTPQS